MASASDGQAMRGVWQIRAPEKTRYRPISGRCHQNIAVGEPRLSQQAAHGRCYHLGCGNIAQSTALRSLPGWADMTAARQKQAQENWSNLQDAGAGQRKRGSAAPNSDDSSAQRIRQSEGSSMDTQSQMHDIAEGANQDDGEAAVEDWLETESDAPANEATAALPDLTLKNINFWREFGWETMRQRWLKIANVPSEVQLSVMQLRSAVAQHRTIPKIGRASE